jgi:hypothetical protein
MSQRRTRIPPGNGSGSSLAGNKRPDTGENTRAMRKRVAHQSFFFMHHVSIRPSPDVCRTPHFSGLILLCSPRPCSSNVSRSVCQSGCEPRCQQVTRQLESSEDQYWPSEHTLDIREEYIYKRTGVPSYCARTTARQRGVA